MVVEFVRGDLFRADVEAIVNAVNCVGVMGKGIALQFKKTFPENFQQYKRACDAGTVQPGSMFIFDNRSRGTPLYLINFPTKRHWRNASRLDDIRSGLAALVADVQRLGIKSIAIPALGCGCGGLDWGIIKPLISQSFAQMPDVRVLVFEPLS